MTNKRKIMIMALFVMLTLSTAGCSTGTDSASDTASVVSTGTANGTDTLAAIEIEYTEEDANASWDNASATHIELSGSNATIDGSGAIAEDGIVTITQVASMSCRVILRAV